MGEPYRNFPGHSMNCRCESCENANANPLAAFPGSGTAPQPASPATGSGVELREALHAALCDYRLTNAVMEGDPDIFYPLIDLCSRDGDTIASGRDELMTLADHLVSDPRVKAALSRSEGAAEGEAVEAVAEAWASMDGKLDAFRACKADAALERTEGRYGGYMADACSLVERIERRGFRLVAAAPSAEGDRVLVPRELTEEQVEGLCQAIFGDERSAVIRYKALAAFRCVLAYGAAAPASPADGGGDLRAVLERIRDWDALYDAFPPDLAMAVKAALASRPAVEGK